MERDRYRKLSKDELSERNRMRRERAAAARRMRAAAGGGAKNAIASSVVYDPSLSAPLALAEEMHHPISELLPHHSHLAGNAVSELRPELPPQADQLPAEASRLTV